MKLSVSLPEGEVAFLDAYARRHGDQSRSSVLREALKWLRASELSADYEAAFEEWSGGDDAEVWDTVTADGLDAAR